jgi:hypothetical protein
VSKESPIEVKRDLLILARGKRHLLTTAYLSHGSRGQGHCYSRDNASKNIGPPLACYSR